MKILVSALEASSNLHLSELTKHLRGVELCGIYEFEGMKGSYTPRDFSVMGFGDVIKKIFFFKRVMNEMVELAKDVDQVLLLDSSSFHIPLAKKIKKRFPEKKISYYILPQVWAWKSWRIKTLKTYFDHLYGILPFEIELYEGRATYIGHPLLDEITKQKQTLSLEGSIVFMPGSREGEIRRIFPILCEVAEYFPQERKVLVVPSFYQKSNLQEIYGEGVKKFEISFDAQEALYEAKFAFICSGTATLQSALIGTPFVLCYKTRKLDEWIVRSLIKLSHIGLANILSLKGGGSEIHAELIQDDCNAENLIRAYKNMNKEVFFSQAQELKKYLKFGSSENLAKEIMK